MAELLTFVIKAQAFKSVNSCLFSTFYFDYENSEMPVWYFMDIPFYLRRYIRPIFMIVYKGYDNTSLKTCTYTNTFLTTEAPMVACKFSSGRHILVFPKRQISAQIV